MEVYQILEGVGSEWDNGVILSDGRGNEYIQEIVTFDNNRTMGAAEFTGNNQPQLYYLDANNTMVPVMETMDGFTFVADIDPMDPDDGEIPSHVLDHMYAKKPREPGTEQIKPIRRRSKKKDQTISHVYVEELIPDAPKINIIRQRRPVSQSLLKTSPKRPKILQGNSISSTVSNTLETNQFFNTGNSSFLTMATPVKPSSLEYHLNLLPSEPTLAQTSKLRNVNNRTVYDDCEIPQPGEMVTVADVVSGGKGAGGVQRRLVTMPSSVGTSVPVVHGDSVCIVSNIQNFGGDDSLSTVTMFDEDKMKIENVVPEEELFFDMIEESEHLFPVGMDVDIDDVELGGSIIVTSARNSTLNFDEMESKSVITKVRKRRQTAIPQPSLLPLQQQQPIDVLVYPSTISSDIEQDKELEESDESQRTESVVKSVIFTPPSPKPSPVKKTMSWKLDGSEKLDNVVQSDFEEQSYTCEVFPVVNSTTSSGVSPEKPSTSVPLILKKVPTATRRSTRPIKLPARLEDHEGVVSKRQRR